MTDIRCSLTSLIPKPPPKHHPVVTSIVYWIIKPLCDRFDSLTLNCQLLRLLQTLMPLLMPHCCHCHCHSHCHCHCHSHCCESLSFLVSRPALNFILRQLEIFDWAMDMFFGQDNTDDNDKSWSSIKFPVFSFQFCTFLIHVSTQIKKRQVSFFKNIRFKYFWYC